MIRVLIFIYMGVIILDTLISYFPSLKYQEWAVMISKLASYTLKPMRKASHQIFSKDLPIDPSPFLVILSLMLIMALW